MKIKNFCLFPILILAFFGCTKIPNENDLLGILGISISEGYVYPRILFINPSNEAKGISKDSKITIDFSKPMDKIAVESAIQLSAPGGNTSFSPSWVFDTRLILNFPEGLTEGKRYEVAFIGSNTKDKDGNRLSKNFLSNFYTIGAGNAPTVTATNPPLSENLQLGWPINQDLTVSFSEPMDPVSTNAAITIEGASAVFTYIWDSNFRNLTLRLRSALNLGATYRLRIASTAKSVDGITLSREYLIAFSTATLLDAPAITADVVLGSPWTALTAEPFINSFNGVSKFDRFRFNFSIPMTVKNITNEIRFSPTISGNYNWLSNQILEFQPNNNLLTSQTYRLQIGRDFVSESGISMVNSYSIDFLVNDPLTSVNIAPVQILGRSYDASCNLEVGIDQTISYPADLSIPIEIRPRYLICPIWYEFEIQLNTAGSARLKLTGDGGLLNVISTTYLSGGEVNASIEIDRIDYIPSANPQRVRVRLKDISGNNVRYLFKLAGGNSGLKDINENILQNNFEFIFYGN
ncbi:Ig-like domain-containing protein [Leptospira jelokensis]|uniref:Ig-like domain-containing protein n=1 Tax=Leptospira jelokensis TaxID=2484931 RepID=UPI0010915A93|nr:Ig-like domain-containing protein [Leptospira jelokensis]TGM06659.1 hypothetical protein EHQ79_01520 [Leptospira jelokensis]